MGLFLMPGILERELVNDMPEPMLVAILEVRHELLDVEVVLEEGSPGGEMEVSDDLVDSYLAGDVASFR